MIEIENLSVSYDDKRVINALNLEVSTGQKLTILGRSGCGKTTLLHSIAGLQCYEGKVEIEKNPVTDLHDNMGIVMQHGGLFKWMTVEENVLLGLLHQSQGESEKRNRLNRLLRYFGLLDRLKAFPYELSGGEAQRIAVARALIANPSYLLMDEPTGALDMISKEYMQDFLHDLYKHFEMTVVTVTHDIEEAVYLGERVLIMDQGMIIADIKNPYYGCDNMRETLAFYQLCLEIRQVMKNGQ